MEDLLRQRALKHCLALGFSFWLGLGLAPSLPAQGYLEENVAPAEVDKERWAAAKEGIDYGRHSPQHQREGKRESQTQRGGGEQEDPAPRRDPPAEPWVGNDTARLILQILFWGILAVLIAILIRYLLGLKATPSNPKVRKGQVTDIDLAAIEEDLPEADLESYLQRAIADGAFTLAVRLYYLILLQGLAEQKILHWKKDKTNHQYLKELRGTPFSEDFEQVTALFEQSWYGDRAVSRERFEAIAPYFQHLAQRIRDTKTAYAQ